MNNRNTFVDGQDVYSDFYGRGKIISTQGDPSINPEHNKKWPLVVRFNDDENFLVTFNVRGWHNFTSPDPAKDIRPLNSREIVRPVFEAGEKMLTRREIFWGVVCVGCAGVGALVGIGVLLFV